MDKDEENTDKEEKKEGDTFEQLKHCKYFNKDRRNKNVFKRQILENQ